MIFYWILGIELNWVELSLKAVYMIISLFFNFYSMTFIFWLVYLELPHVTQLNAVAVGMMSLENQKFSFLFIQFNFAKFKSFWIELIWIDY